MRRLFLIAALTLAACGSRNDIPDNGVVAEGRLLSITRSGNESQRLTLDYLDEHGNAASDAFDIGYRGTNNDLRGTDHMHFNAVPLPGDRIRITKLRSHEYVVDKLE